MSRIVIINGSLRVNGNTDVLIKSLLNGAKTREATINYFVLRDLNISSCKGCHYCNKHNNCAIDDDMQKIHYEIQQSALIILASPMYWWGVTGLMKTFIDRLYLYYPEGNEHLVAGKKILLMIPMHVNEEQHGRISYLSEIEPFQMSSKYIFKRLKMDIVDIIFYQGLNLKGEAAKNRKYLNDTYNLGLKLAELA